MTEEHEAAEVDRLHRETEKVRAELRRRLADSISAKEANALTAKMKLELRERVGAVLYRFASEIEDADSEYELSTIVAKAVEEALEEMDGVERATFAELLTLPPLTPENWKRRI